MQIDTKTIQEKIKEVEDNFEIVKKDIAKIEKQQNELARLKSAKTNELLRLQGENRALENLLGKDKKQATVDKPSEKDGEDLSETNKGEPNK